MVTTPPPFKSLVIIVLFLFRFGCGPDGEGGVIIRNFFQSSVPTLTPTSTGAVLALFAASLTTPPHHTQKEKMKHLQLGIQEAGSF